MTLKKKKPLKIIISGICVLVILTAAFFLWSVKSAYKPSSDMQSLLEHMGAVEVSETDFGLFFDGEGNDTALIFYPGARVEYQCYSPLLKMLAQNKVDCFLVKMPCNMAFFGINKAERIMKDYSYEHWYISGHSLGGAMAASFASKNLDCFDGAVLLAAYPTSSLKADDFKVLSIFGSEDKVLNFKKFEDAERYMPEKYEELCIDGGNHAQFGCYGKQSGDGEAIISRDKQWAQTVIAIIDLIAS